jgi:RsiW-degrading membrane proteinase PrsW (M82 family)
VAEYVVDAEQPGAAALDVRVAAARVKARLSAAQIVADVATRGDHVVRVAVDMGLTSDVDAVLGWRGGLSAYEVDDAFDFAPEDTSGLVARSGAGPDGRSERWWEGDADAVGRAAATAKLDARHRAFAERITGRRFRTRVVSLPAWAEWTSGPGALESIAPAAHGRALALGVGEAARGSLATHLSRPDVGVALARGTSLLATVPATTALKTPIVLSFGDDLAAFARAYDTRRLLESPVLPPMHLIALERAPPRWGVAASCALLPLLVSLAWLLFVRRFDRARPEPWWLVLATFALGGVAVVPAVAAELALASVSPWLDPSCVTLGGQLWSLPIALPVFVVVVGLSEEALKCAAVEALPARRGEFDEPVDGIVYACAAALGFAAVENVKYFALGRMSGAVIALRSFVTVPAHMFFSAIWGYALGQSLVSRRPLVATSLVVAALAHGTFDALLSIESTRVAATLMVVPLGLAFFTLLRRALRHGVVRRPGRASFPLTERLPASALARSYFRMGSTVWFYLCATALIATSCALVGLGAAYEAMHHQVGTPFLAAAGAMLAALGAAGYGTTAAMPLDVAVDAHGVTYAGARQPWGAIFGVEIAMRGARSYVVLRSPRGDLHLGPTRPETARALASAIGAGLALTRP